MSKVIVIYAGSEESALRLSALYHRLNKEEAFEVSLVIQKETEDSLVPIFEIFNIEGDHIVDITNLTNLFKWINPELLLLCGLERDSYIVAKNAKDLGIEVGNIESCLSYIDSGQILLENRSQVRKIANYNFIPSELSKVSLIMDDVLSSTHHIVGNTIIDSFSYLSKGRELSKEQTVMITLHREDKCEETLKDLKQTLVDMVTKYSDINFVIYTNLFVLEGIGQNLKQNYTFEYNSYTEDLEKASIILTDSGNLQELAPVLMKPMLILRRSIERPEILKNSNLKLVGTKSRQVLEYMDELLTDEVFYARMSHSLNPYGEGLSSDRILEVIT